LPPARLARPREYANYRSTIGRSLLARAFVTGSSWAYEETL
jgi:hypothetical protein